MRATYCFFGIALSALSLAAASPPIDKQAFAEYVRYADGLASSVTVLVDDPAPSGFAGFYQVRVHLEANQRKAVKTYYLTEDGQRVAAAPIFDLKKSPFDANLQSLREDQAPATGPENAAISIYVYSDFECPYCREEAKVLRQGIEKKHAGEVRVIFKNFPLEAMHPWARAAALGGVCTARQNTAAFWSFHDWIFEHQSEITAGNIHDRVLEFGKAQSLDEQQLSACMSDSSAASEVDKSLNQGRELGVVQTPTLFVNGRMVGGALQAEGLNRLIEFELEHRQQQRARLRVE